MLKIKGSYSFHRPLDGRSRGQEGFVHVITQEVVTLTNFSGVSTRPKRRKLRKYSGCCFGNDISFHASSRNRPRRDTE